MDTTDTIDISELMQYTYFVFIYYLLTSTFIFYYQFVVVEKLINKKEELTIVLFLKLN